jgi:hypothetical protein
VRQMPENNPLSRFDPPARQDGPPEGHALVLRDYRLLAGMWHPVKTALWLALMRPTEELFARESFVGTTRDGEVRSIPAVLAWAETIARKAIRGDMQAAGIIADRIEGKVATRRDEEDPEDHRRGDMQAVIEFVITAMVNAKIASADDSPEDSAPDRTAVVIDAEAPRRLGDSRTTR